MEKVTGLPDGLSEKVAAATDPAGVRIIGPKRAKCTLWLAKSVETAADFKPSPSVKYPFAPGAFLGVLEVSRRADFTDFRGQELETGLYTLRYGQQPVDGNHVGTSDLADFVLAVPAGDADDPATIATTEELFTKSAAASGSKHPAIFSLIAVEDEADGPALSHNEDRDYWILSTSVAVQKDGKSVRQPLRLIVVGLSEI